MQVRGLQAQIAVTSQQVDTDQHLMKLTEFRRSAGEGTQREVAQAEALLKDAQATLPTLRIAVEAQMNRLDVLMGVQPGTYARELAEPGDIPGIPAIAGADQPTDMLRRRPDVIAAERRLAESNERIGEAISDYYPKISLSGALGFDSLSANRLFSAKAFQPIGSGALRWRLFDFGKVDAEVAQAKGTNAEALAQYRQTVLKAAEDVEKLADNVVADAGACATATGRGRRAGTGSHAVGARLQGRLHHADRRPGRRSAVADRA